MKVDKYIIFWLNISIVVVFLMIFIGGITRLTDSGLSMTDWRPITGVLPPLNESEWQNSFKEYKKFPEYKHYNLNMTLKEYKLIYFWEYLHRMLGRLIGLLFIIPFVFFYFNKYFNKDYLYKFLFLFILGGLQGMMGWYMVKSGLVNNPDISHLRLSVHLSLAIIIISYIYWVKLSLLNSNEVKIKDYSYYNNFINVIIFFVFLQIIYGAFNAGLKAGHFWNEYPLINGHYFPSGILKGDFLYDFIYNNKMIQVIHRNLALVIIFLISFFSYSIISNIKNNFIYNNVMYLILIIFLQFILGVLTLISKSSIIFAITHQFLAVLTVMSILKLKHSLRYSKNVI